MMIQHALAEAELNNGEDDAEQKAGRNKRKGTENRVKQKPEGMSLRAWAEESGVDKVLAALEADGSQRQVHEVGIAMQVALDVVGGQVTKSYVCLYLFLVTLDVVVSQVATSGVHIFVVVVVEAFLPKEGTKSKGHWCVDLSCGRKLRGSLQEGMWRACSLDGTKAFTWGKWGGPSDAATHALHWMGCTGVQCQGHKRCAVGK